MSTRYFQWLGFAFCFCLAVLLIYYLATRPQIITSTSTSNSYSEPEVTGAIQPLPDLLRIDSKWASLGKALFHSKLLSKDNSISCASCHMVDYGGDDGFPLSLGVNSQLGERNSPTVLNAVFNFRQFWDGRSNNLAEQVSGPIHNPKEMATNWAQVIAKLEQASEFKQAFLELGSNRINANDIIRAITAYQETLITPGAPIDLFLKGDLQALSEQQKRGYNKFKNFGCISCHQGKNIGGNLYQKLGRLDQHVPADLLQDLGRYQITNIDSDKHVFKVPSLRNVAETAPYFHNGSVETLEQAVTIMAKAQLGRDLAPEDVQDLVAFLQSLSAPVQGGI